MSNALAIAAVTAVMKDLLDNALIDHSLSAAAGDSVVVTALPPDRVKTGDDEVAQLNLFLYNITPNPAWRNVGLPSLNGRGERLTNPPLAVDLYYLLSAYARMDFEAEILLGYAMQLLHETPVLTRDAIRNTLALPTPVEALLPPAVGALAASDLADQVELIKITPHSVNTEELSKLWTAFQAKYRPSVAYHASVVLIERALPARSPLPVLTRGEVNPATGRERGAIVQPSLRLPYPVLENVVPPADQIAVRLGEQLLLTGHNIGGDEVAVAFTYPRTGSTLELPAELATGTEIMVVMPEDPPAPDVPEDAPEHPANWQAGVYSAAAIIRSANVPDRTTNALAVALAPRIVALEVAGDDGEIVITVTCSPQVRKGQVVSLIVRTTELPPDAFDDGQTETLVFRSSNLPAGAQWVRLRVDGVESLLVDRSTKPPSFRLTEQVVIP